MMERERGRAAPAPRLPPATPDPRFFDRDSPPPTPRKPRHASRGRVWRGRQALKEASGGQAASCPLAPPLASPAALLYPHFFESRSRAATPPRVAGMACLCACGWWRMQREPAGRKRRDARAFAPAPPPPYSHRPLFRTPFHQTLSLTRPDVLPPDVMDELARLQDKIKNFSTDEARSMIETDLGAPIDDLFSEFSAQPIAAASLAQVCDASAEQTDACDAKKRGVCGSGLDSPSVFPLLLRTQVYRARLRSTGQEVAVKVQRPGALSTISKVRKRAFAEMGGERYVVSPSSLRPFAPHSRPRSPHMFPGPLRHASRGWRL